MKLSYNILTQTVAVDVSPQEIAEMTEDAHDHLQRMFTSLVKRMKEGVGV